MEKGIVIVASVNMTFWERTWQERQDEICRVFGPTWPPETVAAFSWDDFPRIPGACALRFPPTEGSGDPLVQLATSTGKFLVLVATGITAREWELAKETTTAHVLLHLCRAGIAQRTTPDRACLLANPRWQEEWTEIEKLAPEECEAELETGIGRWHLAKPLEA